MNRLTRDGTAEPVSRDQILRHARGQGNVHFPCSADHEQDWQPSYPVDPYPAICDDHTYIHNTYILATCLVGDLQNGSTRYWNYLENYYWSRTCAGGLSTVNDIGTQLRDPINSRLTRCWRRAVWRFKRINGRRAEIGRNPVVSKHQIQPAVYGE